MTRHSPIEIIHLCLRQRLSFLQARFAMSAITALARPFAGFRAILLAIGVLGGLAALGVFAAMAAASPAPKGLKVRTAEGTFEDVLFAVKDAIVGRGFKIDYNGQIGAMLKRTAKEFGNPKPVYKDAQFFTFCSVKLTRAMLAADPANVGFCPYVVYVYQRLDEPDKVYVGYREVIVSGSEASQKALKAINAFLESIVREATE